MGKSSIDLDLWGITDKETIQDDILKPYGVGFYSDEKYLDSEEINSKCHQNWLRILALCFSISQSFDKARRKKEYTVCKEWLDYTQFKKWYDENYYELDNEKTVLSPMCIKKGNTHFCPQLCVFVSPTILGLLYGSGNVKKEDGDTENEDKKKYVYGVRREGNKYMTTMKIAPELNGNSDTYFIGRFDTEEDAFVNYKIIKELYIKGLAYHYKDKIPEKLYNAMLNWEIEKDDNTVKYENSRTRKDIFRLQK